MSRDCVNTLFITNGLQGVSLGLVMQRLTRNSSEYYSMYMSIYVPPYDIMLMKQVWKM